MDSFIILAQAAEAASKTASNGHVVPMEAIWAHITRLGVLEALTFMSFGVVCLFYGWRVFKLLVVISFAMFGLIIGMMISQKVGVTGNPILGIIVAIVLGVVAIPLTRWGVSILGAMAGGIITAGLWYAIRLPEQYIWAGALIGIVAGGMISFIVFRIAVMLFSSLGGSALIVTGLLALLYHYGPTKEHIHSLFFTAKWFLPVVIIIPTIFGIWLQNKLIKGAQSWSI